MTNMIFAFVLVAAVSIAQGGKVAPVYPPKPAYPPKYQPGCQVHAFGSSITDEAVDVDDQHGFRLLSNGPNWVTHFGRLIGCADESVRSYAYSGALSNQDNYFFKGWSGTQWQVDTYLKYDLRRFYSYGYPNIIIVFEAGGFNDLYNAAAAKADEDGFKQVRKDAVKNTAQQLRKLMRAGLYTFVVLDVFEPMTDAKGLSEDEYKDSLELFNSTLLEINEKLVEKIEDLRYQYPKVRIVHVRTKGMSMELKDKFSAGEEPFTHHKEGLQWKEWEKHAWFDAYRPTTAVHKLIAERAFAAWNQQTYVRPVFQPYKPRP